MNVWSQQNFVKDWRSSF